MIEPYILNITKIETDNYNKIIYFSWSPFSTDTAPLFSISCDNLIKLYSIDYFKEES